MYTYISLAERQVKDLPLVASESLNAPTDVLKVKVALEKMDEVTVTTAYQLWGPVTVSVPVSVSVSVSVSVCLCICTCVCACDCVCVCVCVCVCICVCSLCPPPPGGDTPRV
jgi:hypothetical protein